MFTYKHTLWTICFVWMFAVTQSTWRKEKKISFSSVTHSLDTNVLCLQRPFQKFQVHWNIHHAAARPIYQNTAAFLVPIMQGVVLTNQASRSIWMELTCIHRRLFFVPYSPSSSRSFLYHQKYTSDFLVNLYVTKFAFSQHSYICSVR